MSNSATLKSKNFYSYYACLDKETNRISVTSKTPVNKDSHLSLVTNKPSYENSSEGLLEFLRDIGLTKKEFLSDLVLDHEAILDCIQSKYTFHVDIYPKEDRIFMSIYPEDESSGIISLGVWRTEGRNVFVEINDGRITTKEMIDDRYQSDGYLSLGVFFYADKIDVGKYRRFIIEDNKDRVTFSIVATGDGRPQIYIFEGK